MVLNIINNSRKVDKDLFNNCSKDFIPIACHYNDKTLLTKNGELLQTIKINGINSENISSKLFNIRDIIRNSIKKNVKNNKLAFWVHTIREKANLDDSTPYNKLLPANIHNIWQKKNYWDEKFINTLYITLVYDSADLQIKNFGTFLTSLSFKKVVTFHNKYLESALLELTSIVESIALDLKECNIKNLGISFNNDNSYSELMSLYSRIINLNTEESLVPITNIASALSTNSYAVGNDKIEVINHQGVKKFTSILSIKEYQETSPLILDNFLQLPIEFIITEIFYFIEKKVVKKSYEAQSSILNISKDNELAEISGLTKLMNQPVSNRYAFCNQQISVSIISNDLSLLEQHVKKTSLELGKIGIVHVREDINLEQTFWSQLPGNFSYIRRMTPTIIENIAAFSSLHNLPTGETKNVWGKAMTLLRTEKGTPYFMNLHSKTNQRANTSIFGAHHSGKTILTNFLISEATKYNPNILYISNNTHSKIFIEAIEGKWREPEEKIFNPLALKDTKEARFFVKEFLKILCDNNNIPLIEEELHFIDKMVDLIFKFDKKDRFFSKVLESLDFTETGGIQIQKKLSDYQISGLYYGVFDTDIEIFDNSTIGLNLSFFLEELFINKIYNEKFKILNNNINDYRSKHHNFLTSILYSLTYHFTNINDNPKILVFDNLDPIYRLEEFYHTSELISEILYKSNGILINNYNIQKIIFQESKKITNWLNLIDTIILLPSEVPEEFLEVVLGLKENEIAQMSKISLNSRMFLMKKDNESIILELSIGGLIGINKILSCRDPELTIYNKIISLYPGHPDDWINKLYTSLNVLS